MPYLIPGLFIAVGCLNIGIGTYVLLHNLHGRSNRAFFVFSLGAGLWIGGFGLLLLTHHEVFIPFLNLGGLFLIAGLFRFAQVFPEGTGRRLHNVWHAPFALGALAALYPGLLIQDVTFTATGATPTQGPWFPYYAAAFGIYTIASIALLFKSYRRTTRMQQARLQYFFLGMSTFIGIAVICDALLPAFGFFSLNFVGPLSSVISIIATAYAVARHELMDIRVVIQRGLVYTVLLVTILCGYAFFAVTLGFLFGLNSNTTFVSALITTVIGILTAPRIEQVFRKITNPIFFKDPYDYQEVLQRLSEALHRSMEYGAMTQRVRTILNETFHPESITLRDTGEITLGTKRSGDPYTTEDARLLTTASHQAAIAFERARLFDQVKRYTTDLEQKVIERTEQLRQSQEKQTQMILDISHGLQTPLTIIQARLDQLKRINAQDTDLKHFESSLADVSHFMRSLLKLAQLEKGREDLSVEPVCLSDLLAEIAEEMEIIAGTQGISVHRRITPGVYADINVKRLRDAIMNLAHNSIKYMRPSGKKEIIFSVQVIDETPTVSITDTGIGISKADLPHVFERFFRAHSPRNSNGCGLGLAISKRIIEQHSGTLAATSTLGEGTTMTIRFPERMG